MTRMHSELSTLDLLFHPSMKLQHSLLLLTKCFQLKPLFLLRCLPPRITYQGASMLRDRLASTVHQMLAFPGDPMPAFLAAQTLLPPKLGGLGIIDLPAAAPPSFYSSLANASLHFKPCEAFDNWTERHAIHDLLAQHALHLLPSDPSLASFTSHFAQHSPAGLQRCLSATLHSTNFSRLLSSPMPPADYACIVSCSAPFSSALFHTLPTLPALSIDDGPLRLALRLRLGLPPFPASVIADLPHRCSMSHPLRDNPTHGLDCNKSRGLTIKRHNTIRDHIGTVASSLGIFFEAEPLSLARSPNDIRADGLLQLGDALPTNRYAFDVTVWHPTAPSHISTAAHSLAVARQAADDKVLKFADQIRSSRHCEHFLPVAIETYGGLEPRAVDLLRLIAAHGAAQSPLTQGEIMAHLVGGITVALHKGNYELLQSARRAL